MRKTWLNIAILQFIMKVNFIFFSYFLNTYLFPSF
jgi:hypothetical protein